MILILKNITKLFEPNYNNLDAQLWVQKVILKKYFKKNKFVFLYAPNFHPTMKHVAPVRKRLKVSTIFNKYC